MAIQRLTVAYRSRSRPSSTLGAKASTVCPYYLDGDLAQRNPRVVQGPVIPVFSRRLSMAADCGFCAVFKDRGEAYNASRSRVTRSRRFRDVSTRTGGRRSLKTQQHAARR